MKSHRRRSFRALRPAWLLSPALACIGLALASAGCGSAPTAPIPFTLRYGGDGADAPLQLEPQGPIESPWRSEDVLVARVKSDAPPGKPIVSRAPAAGESDAVTAQRMAEIAQWSIQKELGLDDGLGLVVLLYPIASYHACVATAALSPEIGVAAGIPSIGGAIHARHATSFLYQLVRGYVVSYLTLPAIAQCDLYRRSPENRWIAEGIASLVAVQSFAHALKEGIHLSPMSFLEALEEAKKSDRQYVQIAGWTPTPRGSESRSENLLRLAAAEHVCVRWYAAARKRGAKNPVVQLLEFCAAREFGPSYDELTEWMRRTSGLDVARLAREVPVDDLVKYHTATWKAMNWTRGAQESGQNPGGR